ncbi:hypothetical protein Hamer_G004990 [Homarus americanus]|uniref:Uncharacterized protein n=1 Tax=Homarus americanus TaxID=6706 RepID=A0A8J5K072_HOMAM|nr:hypothetical protein Hamer_G004990 [Homarus americanus]
MGWRASRWSGGDDGGESDTSEASARSLGRRPQFSRAPSRELHNIPDEELGMMGSRGYPGGGMSLPRPYPASSSGNLTQNRGMHDSADRIAAMYGTLRSQHRRPHSTVGGQPGECIGRDGGLCEQQLQRPAPLNTASHTCVQKDQHTSQLSPSGQSSEDTEALKQSVQEQLKQLVRELEAGEDEAPEVPKLPDQQQLRGNNTHSEMFSPTRGLPAQFSGTPNTSSTRTFSPNTQMYCSGKPMYSSNPALHISCTPIQRSSTQTHSESTTGYHGTPPVMTNNMRANSEHATRLRKNLGFVNKAEASDATVITSACGVTNTVPANSASTSNIPMLRTDAGASDRKNRALSVHPTPSDHIGYNTILDICREGAISPSNSDGVPESGGIRRALSSREEWLKSGNTFVKSADNSALDAYRRSRGKVNIHEHQGGKPEDICCTTDSLSRVESQQNRSVPIHSLFNRQYSSDIKTNAPLPDTKTYGNDMRISPFEAYRRNKSRELPIEAVKKDPPTVRLKSPLPAPDRSKSPFEKARTSIEKKFDHAKSPERAPNQNNEGAANPIRAPPTPNLNQLSTCIAKENKINKSEDETVVQEKERKTEHKNHKDKERFIEKDLNQEEVQVKKKENEKEKELNKDNEKDRGKVKKTSSCDPEKPKSMYKLLASRFNRSGSSVSDNTRSATDKRPEDDDAPEKEEKFRLKRPSRFLKHKTEKSSSKSSVCEGDGTLDDSERPERKPSKKLTDALNKFLGRKDTKEESRTSLNSMSQPSIPTASADEEHPKKPPRMKSKKFSKSQENLFLSRVEEGGELGSGSPLTERAQSVVPEGSPANLQPSYTLESVTKSICDHLSQLESDITSRIGNMGVQESGAGVKTSGGSRVTPAVSSVGSITTYGLSPALASRRNGRPTNLDLAAANIDNHHPPTVPAQTVDKNTKTSSNHIPSNEGEGVKYAQIKKLAGSGNVDPLQDGNHSQTQLRESSTIGIEDPRGLSENEDESVMDRITRKSYYSKFQDKKKPKLRRANTKEDMDQQLAAAKARLMKEETEKTVRESLSPLRYASPVTSPRASVTSPPSWEIPRRHSRKSLPPEDPTIFLMGGRRGMSLQPDDLPGIRRFTSVQPDDIQSIRRLPSLPPEDRHYTHRAPSMPLEDYSLNHRIKSIPPEDRPYTYRAPSMPPDNISSKSRKNSNLPNDSKAHPSSPNIDNELDGERVQDAVAAAVAAGALAGEAAAVVAAVDSSTERGSSKSREPSVSRLRSPDPPNRLTPSHDDTRNLAREELSRRLTHLTRISGTSGQSGWNRGGLNGGGKTGDVGEKRVYRRTNTTGHLGEALPGISQSGVNPGLSVRPVYRRTNTMDLPPADARARPGSEYRRQLQDPARRFSAARTLVEEEALPTSSPRTPSSRLVSPSFSSSLSSHRSYSNMDPPRYNSSLSSNILPLTRRTSFYRY